MGAVTMRLADRANGGMWSFNGYTIIKRAWERQYAIFHRGRCVHDTIRKDEAINWIISQSIQGKS
jgi:hypothetical protein